MFEFSETWKYSTNALKWGVNHFCRSSQTLVDWLASLYMYIDIETGTVWLTQWLIFQSLILESTHHQNSGKYTFPHLCDLLCALDHAVVKEKQVKSS